MGIQLTECLSKTRSAIELVHQQVSSSLASLQSSNSFPFLARVKTESSTLQKIETGRFASFLELDDLVAFCIIIPDPSFEHQAVDHLRRSFEVIAIKDKSKSTFDPTSFGFDITRVVAKLAFSDSSSVSVPFADKIKFEVQIRTAFEHAWAVAVHDQVYKTKVIDLRKIRLASEIKAQIESLDRLLMNFSTESEAILRSPDQKFRNQLATLELLEELQSLGYINENQWPSDLRRETENILMILDGVGFADERFKVTLQDIRRIVDERRSLAFPSSVSLVQCFAALMKELGKLSIPRKKVIHISQEAEVLLPVLKSIGRRFDYSLPEIPLLAE